MLIKLTKQVIQATRHANGGSVGADELGFGEGYPTPADWGGEDLPILKWSSI